MALAVLALTCCASRTVHVPASAALTPRGWRLRVVTPVFTTAEVHNKDEVVPAAQPRAPLFRLPGEARYVRLIYLVRVSQADHDTAVVTANKKDALDSLTAQVRANPENCRSGRGTFCAWIPGGIAVPPEMRTVAAGAEQWAPAR